MLKNRIVYIIFIGFSILLQALYRNDLPYSTVLFAIILTCFSFVYFIICIFSLKYSLVLHTDTFEKKEQARMELQIESNIPIPYLVFSYYSPFATTKITKSSSLLSEKKITIDLCAVCTHIGVYTLKVDSIVITDLFGIFKWKLSLHDSKKFYVLPKIYPFPLLKTAYANQDVSSSEQSVQSGMVDSVREFMQYDNAKHIHWNLSSKLDDDFYTKTFVEQNSPMFTIISDLKSENVENTLSKKEAETILETTLSLANIVNEQAVTCNLLWFDEKNNAITLKEHYVLNQEKDPEEVLLFFDLYAKGPYLHEILALHQTELEQHTIFIVSTSLTPLTVQCLIEQSRHFKACLRFIYIDPMGGIANKKNLLYHLHESNIPVFIIEKLDPSTLYQLI